MKMSPSWSPAVAMGVYGPREEKAELLRETPGWSVYISIRRIKGRPQ